MEKSIVIFTFPGDDGSWINQIVSSFIKTISDANIPARYYTITRTGYLFEDNDQLVNDAMLHQPDVIFLPDDMMYLNLATKFRERTKALILFTSIYIRPDEILKIENQGGVYCQPSFKQFLSQINSISQIRRIGLVSGPEKWDEKSIETITKGFIEAGVDVEVASASTWSEYVKNFKRFELTKDAIFPMVPCGVMDNGIAVSDHQMASLMESSKKLTIDYAWLVTYKRGIFLRVDPKSLGITSAAKVISYLKGDIVSVEEYKSYAFQISDLLLKKLNLVIPVELKSYVVP